MLLYAMLSTAVLVIVIVVSVIVIFIVIVVIIVIVIVIIIVLMMVIWQGRDLTEDANVMSPHYDATLHHGGLRSHFQNNMRQFLVC